MDRRPHGRQTHEDDNSLRRIAANAPLTHIRSGSRSTPRSKIFDISPIHFGDRATVRGLSVESGTGSCLIVLLTRPRSKKVFDMSKTFFDPLRSIQGQVWIGTFGKGSAMVRGSRK